MARCALISDVPRKHDTVEQHVQDVHHENERQKHRTRAGMWVLLALFVGTRASSGHDSGIRARVRICKRNVSR